MVNGSGSVPAATFVETAVTDRVLTITLNRPDKRNALTVEMYRALVTALSTAQVDDTIRCVIITGRGAGFCAGNDMQDFLRRPPTSSDHPVIQFLAALAGFQKPLLAAVHGAAIGVGTTLLLHCDLVYAAQDTKLQTPFVNLGLVPEAGSSRLLPAMLGQQRAAELLLLGEPIDANKALSFGLVNQIAATADAALALAEAAAAKLAAKPPTALARTKSLMRSDGGRLTKQIEEEARLFAACLSSPELEEAVTAFLEKRAPDFSGF